MTHMALEVKEVITWTRLVYVLGFHCVVVLQAAIVDLCVIIASFKVTFFLFVEK